MEFTHTAKPVPVNAAVILDVTRIQFPEGVGATSPHLMLRLSDGRNYEADTSMTSRYTPVVGDYLVTQEDGYEYLNPKDVFERKYSAIPRSSLPAYQQRVVDEKSDLDVKIGALNGFIAANPNFSNLAPDEQQRLNDQLVIMRNYSEILGRRISFF